ncbi:MAG: nucleotide sugar dehydrogenase [Verrucomicrobiota bacterium]
MGVVGLGYVGLPLAVAFGQNSHVIGFDTNQTRVEELNSGKDRTNETDPEQLAAADIEYTATPLKLQECSVLIVAVPTPVNKAKRPDLTPVCSASRTVGEILKPGMLVVFESTVYPGVTEDICLPILEEESGLSRDQFSIGYSPERINPGDKKHTLSSVIKVVSGDNPETLERVAKVYETVIEAGVHRAPTIKTAEAAKVIENIQRDLNIALMNELSKIFSRINVNTDEVLEAAATKWNFHRYNPGLVGGHCIGVDPYYMTHLAFQLDMSPRVILAGRETNDSMGRYVAGMVVRKLAIRGKRLLDSRVLLMGLTFKEDVPDYRNSQALDVVHHLQEFGIHVYGCEPLLEDDVVSGFFNSEPVQIDNLPEVDAVVIINRHRKFAETCGLDDIAGLMEKPLIFDLKNLLNRNEAASKNIDYITL